MFFNPSRKHAFPPELTVGQSPILQVVPVIKLLGVMIQEDLRWGAQVKYMASKKIWMLRRMKNLGVDEETISKYWASECRVHLENSCSVWNGEMTVKQSRDLERTQRRALASYTSWGQNYEENC